MKKEERLKIGKSVYNHEITRYEAAKKYNLNPFTIRDYMREYRDYYGLVPSNEKKRGK